MLPEQSFPLAAPRCLSLVVHCTFCGASTDVAAVCDHCEEPHCGEHAAAVTHECPDIDHYATGAVADRPMRATESPQAREGGHRAFDKYRGDSETKRPAGETLGSGKTGLRRAVLTVLQLSWLRRGVLMQIGGGVLAGLSVWRLLDGAWTAEGVTILGQSAQLPVDPGAALLMFLGLAAVLAGKRL